MNLLLDQVESLQMSALCRMRRWVHWKSSYPMQQGLWMLEFSKFLQYYLICSNLFVLTNYINVFRFMFYRRINYLTCLMMPSWGAFSCIRRGVVFQQFMESFSQCQSHLPLLRSISSFMSGYTSMSTYLIFIIWFWDLDCNF